MSQGRIAVWMRRALHREVLREFARCRHQALDRALLRPTAPYAGDPEKVWEASLPAKAREMLRRSKHRDSVGDPERAGSRWERAAAAADEREAEAAAEREAAAREKALAAAGGRQAKDLPPQRRASVAETTAAAASLAGGSVWLSFKEAVG